MIYLDNAATTLRKPPQVIDAVRARWGASATVPAARTRVR